MMWTLTLPDGSTVTEASLRHGEHTAIYALVSEQQPHREVDLDPLHCPICRSAHLALLAGTRLGVDVMAEQVRIGGLSRDQVLALVHVETPTGT